MFYLSLILICASLGVWVIQVSQENRRLQNRLKRYEGLMSKEKIEIKLNESIDRKHEEISLLDQEERQKKMRLEELDVKISILEEENHLQNLGFYEPKYDFRASEDYKIRFNQITAERKVMIRDGVAAFCRKDWSVGSDAKKGRKMIQDYLKVIREAFDIVCDTAVNEVKTGNINLLKKRINKNFERINKSSIVLESEISEKYLKLRLIELDIKYEMEIKIREEKEREKIIRDKLKSEKEDRERLDKAKIQEEEACEREQILEKERDKIRAEMEQAIGYKLEDLERRKEHYEKLIAQAREDREKAVASYRQVKSGTIYVVSNEGSFGEGVHRIFMTKNNEPDKYVKTMNPIVPFPFTVRLKAYSEDVSDTLERIHSEFQGKRINNVNMRREYFRVSYEEIKEVVNKVSLSTGLIKSIEECEYIPLENEYILSLGKGSK